MSEISRVDIEHLAKLARLTLSDEEGKNFSKQLPGILEFVDQLQAVTKSGSTEKETELTLLANLRTDVESGDRLTLEDLSKLAPAWRDNQVEVPEVFGEVVDA